MVTEKLNIKEALLFNIQNQNTNNSQNTNLPFLELRQEALQALSTLELPTSRSEEWKYTDITKELRKNFDFSKINSRVDFSSQQVTKYKFSGLDAYYLVFINGSYNSTISSLPVENGKITVSSLSDAFAKNESLFKEHFSKHVDFHKDIFSALSTAYTNDGIFLKVEKNTILEKPFVFLFISDSTNGNTISQPRNLIFADQGSAIKIIENYISIGENPQFTNIVNEVIVEENANVEIFKFQHESEHSFHVGTTQVNQAKNSNFSSITITTNGGMVRNNLNIKLDGENANAYMYGLYLLHGHTHVDNHTIVDHAKPHTYSNELYKGIMDDKSTGVFNGKIFVRQDAQKTNAFQSNRNVLLSEEASIYTKPQLEIWADDVKCSHGATTGQIDEEALFYLQSRGISKDSAKALLMIAFASEIVEEIKIKEIKGHIEHLIGQLLHK